MEHSIQDAGLTRNGERRVISKRMLYVEQDTLPAATIQPRTRFRGNQRQLRLRGSTFTGRRAMLTDEPEHTNPKVTLRNFLVVREEIYTHFQDSQACVEYFIAGENNQDKYATYYTAMYLLQDTSESLIFHRDKGFSENPMAAYIEFWGVMQALIIHQDAIQELHSVVFENDDWRLESKAWQDLRRLRNECAGHPINQRYGNPASKRSFIGRSFGNYDNITIEQWDAHSKKVSYNNFNLGALIGEYSAVATDLIEEILFKMKRRWP